MSDKIKYGESYKSLADNITPYLIETLPSVNTTFDISIYPPWWESTLTIYNSYENKTTNLVTWYKHILTRCYFKNIYESIELGNIVANNNSTLVRIPQNNLFLSYDEWIKVPNINMSKYFTLHQGDIIIKGKVDDIIDETKKGMFSNDIIEKYKSLGTCTIIQSVQINTGNTVGIPHYRIMGD